MRTASAEEVQAQFDAYLEATVKGPVVVTRDSKPVAVLLSVKDPDEIERIAMSQSKKLREILQRSQMQIEQGKGIPHDRFWREIKQMRKGRPARNSRSGSARRRPKQAVEERTGA